MQIQPLKIPGTYRILLEPHHDKRGYFLRTYEAAIFRERGLSTEWVNDSQAFSVRNVVRGLHFQKPPFSETKLVRAVVGKAIDVFVDLRKSSPAFGQWDMVELSEQNHAAVYIPKGFAHGYCTPDGDAVVAYKVDSPYAPESEGGLRWNDPDLGIPWPVTDPTVSVKDTLWPLFRGFTTPFD